MKKLLLIVLLLAPGLCFADLDTLDGSAITTSTLYADGAAIASGGAASDCDSRGTADFLWTGDNASGTDYACISGGTQQASGGDSPTIDSSVSESTSTLHNGSNTVLLDADGNHRLTFTVTSEDIVDLTLGTIELYVYPVEASVSANSEIAYVYGDSNDYIQIVVMSTGQPRIYHSGSGTVHTVTCTNSVTMQAWNVIKASWDVTGDSLSIKLNSDATNNDADDLGAVGTNAGSLGIGQSIGVINHDFRIDDVRSWSGVDDL